MKEERRGKNELEEYKIKKKLCGENENICLKIKMKRNNKNPALKVTILRKDIPWSYMKEKNDEINEWKRKKWRRKKKGRNEGERRKKEMKEKDYLSIDLRLVRTQREKSPY